MALLSDDVFRARLRSAVADLTAQVTSYGDVASVDMGETPDTIRFALMPRVNGACPVELLLRADQHYDIAIGGELYEDCPIEQLGLFAQLVGAITRGDVIQRHQTEAATGAPHAVETIVMLACGTVWRMGHARPLPPAARDDLILNRDRRFLPYRR